MSILKLRSFSELAKGVKSLAVIQTKFSSSLIKKDGDVVTHTGQSYRKDDYRNARFLEATKVVNPNFAIDLIKQDPVVVCNRSVVYSHSGGPLGHPGVFINLDKPGVHTCGYSGRKFVHKRYYDEKSMGPHISYQAYCEQVDLDPDN